MKTKSIGIILCLLIAMFAFGESNAIVGDVYMTPMCASLQDILYEYEDTVTYFNAFYKTIRSPNIRSSVSVASTVVTIASHKKTFDDAYKRSRKLADRKGNNTAKHNLKSLHDKVTDTMNNCSLQASDYIISSISGKDKANAKITYERILKTRCIRPLKTAQQSFCSR